MPNSKEASVGFVIFVAGVILIVGILAVGKESRFFTRKVEYWTEFPNVSGLAEGSPVQLVGVRVGTVSRVEFSPDLGDRQIRVIILVNRAFSDRIREGTEALIKSLSYVSQERYIELTPGDPERPVLPPGSRIEPGISGLAELTEMGRGIADDVKDITSQLRELLIALNKGGGILPEMIRNPDFGRDSLQGIHETVSSIQRISGRIERGEGLAGQLIMNKEYAGRQMASLDASLDRLRGLLEKIDSGQGAAGEILAKGGKGEQLLDNLLSASADLKGDAGTDPGRKRPGRKVDPGRRGGEEHPHQPGEDRGPPGIDHGQDRPGGGERGGPHQQSGGVRGAPGRGGRGPEEPDGKGNDPSLREEGEPGARKGGGPPAQRQSLNRRRTVTLKEKIESRKARVGIIGLGYVGLPLACEYVRAGFPVTGIDNDPSKVEQLNRGSSYVQDVPGRDAEGPDRAEGRSPPPPTWRP